MSDHVKTTLCHDITTYDISIVAALQDSQPQQFPAKFQGVGKFNGGVLSLGNTGDCLRL